MTLNPLRITFHQAGGGTCCLSGKEGDGVTVTFEDGTVNQQHLSWKSLRQLVAMKVSPKTAKPEPRPVVPIAAAAPALAAVK